jgi:hypothetical protein
MKITAPMMATSLLMIQDLEEGGQSEENRSH